MLYFNYTLTLFIFYILLLCENYILVQNKVISFTYATKNETMEEMGMGLFGPRDRYIYDLGKAFQKL